MIGELLGGYLALMLPMAKVKGFTLYFSR